MTRTGAVAVIGLGSMGRGAALSLLRAGLETHAFDIRPEARADFAAQGGLAHETAAAAVAAAEVVFLFVVNADQAEDVLFGTGQAVAVAQSGTVFAVSVTQDPARAEDQARRLREAGMLPLDAPVSGGSAKALAGEMSVMASGPEAAFLKAGPALDAIAGRVFRLGAAPGAASKMKMINQLLAGVHIAAAAEAMVLARAAGLDLHEVIGVIGDCAGMSWMFGNRAPHIANGDYTPHSAVDIFVKDLGIVTGAALGLGASVPLSDSALALFREAAGAGLGREDDAAVAKVLAARAGVTLPGSGG
ncbi:L-threonate dehydrogenase [Rhodobacter sp. 24-YEA-8]|uniref:L-threonate dehydrogenase n=1 Tax=Rhodobacter sp. 24-YEA-8 TaxID=1884310 RepID=UPI00089B5EC8|nr:L-threonate dehydrogenase [Rhodobacter sp. 24-YEA-8]SED85963.1 3-hydroxyisobutyrate dehydrogenase/2-hydroxy-3-oxopropionate reductase [Rhodobacter sp. 24-YEA-8]